MPPDHVDAVWEQVGPMLKKATHLSAGRYRIGDLYGLIAGGSCHLWIVFEPGMKIISAATSVFNVYPGGKWLTAQFMGGAEAYGCRDIFLDTFERWAKDNGCKGVEFGGRSGWTRVLKPRGYIDYHRFFQKEL